MNLLLTIPMVLLGYFIGSFLDNIQRGEPYTQANKQCSSAILTTSSIETASLCTVETTKYGWPFVSREEHKVDSASSLVLLSATGGTIIEKKNQITTGGRGTGGASASANVLLSVVLAVGLPYLIYWQIGNVYLNRDLKKYSPKIGKQL